MSDERRIEYIAVSELMTRLHPQNPKEHDLGALIESFKVHGYVASGVIDDRTGLFLAGHGRVQALNMMHKQGMEAPQGIRNGGGDWLAPVQVGYSSKNDVQAKAYIVADNKLTELGGWNEAMLAKLLEEFHFSDEIEIEASAMSAEDLDELLRDIAGYDTPSDGEWCDAFENLPDGDRQPFQQITFTLHDSQIETIKKAITKSKTMGAFETENENSNGNAIARVCEVFNNG